MTAIYTMMQRIFVSVALIVHLSSSTNSTNSSNKRENTIEINLQYETKIDGSTTFFIGQVKPLEKVNILFIGINTEFQKLSLNYVNVINIYLLY